MIAFKNIVSHETLLMNRHSLVIIYNTYINLLKNNDISLFYCNF